MLLCVFLIPDQIKEQFKIESTSLFSHQVVNGAFRSVENLNMPYQILNTVEGMAWIVIGFLVLHRAKWIKASLLECVYFIAFILFGVSDFIEVSTYPLWLAFWKLFNVLTLLYVRSLVMRRMYPQAKVY